MKRAFITFTAIFSILPLMAQSLDADSIAGPQLNEVVVKGERPRIKGHDGMMVVDLPR